MLNTAGFVLCVDFNSRHREEQVSEGLLTLLAVFLVIGNSRQCQAIFTSGSREAGETGRNLGTSVAVNRFPLKRLISIKK